MKKKHIWIRFSVIIACLSSLEYRFFMMHAHPSKHKPQFILCKCVFVCFAFGKTEMKWMRIRGKKHFKNRTRNSILPFWVKHKPRTKQTGMFLSLSSYSCEYLYCISTIPFRFIFLLALHIKPIYASHLSHSYTFFYLFWLIYLVLSNNVIIIFTFIALPSMNIIFFKNLFENVLLQC